MVTSRSQTIRRRLGSVTLTGQGLGLGLGTSLFPVGATEIKGLPWQPSRRRTEVGGSPMGSRPQTVARLVGLGTRPVSIMHACCGAVRTPGGFVRCCKPTLHLHF